MAAKKKAVKKPAKKKWFWLSSAVLAWQIMAPLSLGDHRKRSLGYLVFSKADFNDYLASATERQTVVVPSGFFEFFHKAAEWVVLRRVTQLSPGLGFDLTDTLARNVKLFAHLLERVIGDHFDAKADA